MPTIDAVLRDSLYLTDAIGTAITGADPGDFTATATMLGSATTAAVTISEDADGWYQTSFTPAAAGRWRLVVAYDDGATERIFTETYDVSETDPGDADTLAAAVIAALPARQVVTVASPVATDGTANVVKGDEATLTFTNSGWSITEGNSIALTVTYAGTSTTYSGTRVSATSVSVALTEADTEALTPGKSHYVYSLRDTTADSTLAVGTLTVRAS